MLPMKQTNKKTAPKKVEPVEPFSYRVPRDMEKDFLDVKNASRRTKASLLHESLEKMLPVFKRRYLPKPEIAK